MKSFKQFLNEARRSLEGTYALNGVYDERPFYDEIVDRMPKLTKVEQGVLDRYTNGALVLNRDLRNAADRARKRDGIRNPSTEDVQRQLQAFGGKDTVRELDDLIAQKGISLVRPFTTYRGVVNPSDWEDRMVLPDEHKKIISGRQHGYISTSISPRAAASLPTSEVLAKQDWVKRFPRLLKIRVAPGTRFLPNPQQTSSRFRGENEILFPRGMHLDTEETPSRHMRFYTRDKHSGFETTTHSMPVHRSRLSHGRDHKG